MFFGGGGRGGFPFGNFGSHDENDDQHQGNQQVDNTKYYEVLQCGKDASQAQIKKKYLDLAKKYHPDKKEGSKQKFNEIKQAYQALGDPQKRRLYDKFGSKGPQQDPNDILNHFFGGGRGGQTAKKQMAKVKPTKLALKVSLQSIYNGSVMKVPQKRTRVCEGCNGKGGEGVQKCKPCKGRGQVIQMMQLGPGMYQQVQKHCDTCKGQGQIIKQGKKCKVCNGQKILQKEKVMQVAIDKGLPNNHPIVLSGEGNQIPDALAGDLIFVAQQQSHPIFTRKGADLFMKKTISLAEALTGFQFVITHLDNSQILITTAKGQIISDKQKKTVRGLGMPYYKDPMSHGNLIIQFHILMPKRGTITKENLQILATLLPGKVNPRPQGDKYQMMQDFEIENVNTNEQGGRKQKQQEQYEQAQGGPGVGCASQ